LPTQGLHITSVQIELRHPPTLDTILQVGLSGAGGNCLQLNYFIRVLLESIGYDVSTISGTIGVLVRDNHVMTLVRFPDTGHTYLVDLASASPLCQPVPLHDLPWSFQTTAAGTRVEYRKVAENEYARFQVGGGLFRDRLVSYLSRG